jgi:hypothetical protein
LDDRSRMNREVHVRFWEGVGVKLLCATRLSACVRLRRSGQGREVQAGLTKYFHFYNRERLHQSHEYQTPDEMYFATTADEPLAIAA